MKITVLGEHAPYPAAGGATIGYLVDTGEGRVLLDCGSGVLSELLKTTGWSQLNAVILSHYHADHVADLGVLQYGIMVARKTGQREQPLTIYANREPKEKFQEVSYGNHVTAIPLDAQSDISLCGAEFRFADTVHAVPCLAVSITKGGKKVVFSSDTGPCSAVANLARAANLFICEASWLEKDRGSAEVGHLTARQAGEIAKQAGVQKLCLTHLYPGYEVNELLKEAAETFQGELFAAKQGMVIHV
ncbi:MBL fold metallo-hydrolase [Effusibacillus dendaii]|uniref:Putative metallo-hydrolase YhfI n=1 Tax=Effusibacillus dendaii TaxID=2743772 RepID=A0A7I8D9T7_9BACL|nr:MBL fold metallo-hydrolase [Effusibacillus dendaii]BCJ85739.1 putative metallo-hydrolase YhfI [Effusibacillus dendaii]